MSHSWHQLTGMIPANTPQRRSPDASAIHFIAARTAGRQWQIGSQKCRYALDEAVQLFCGELVEPADGDGGSCTSD